MGWTGLDDDARIKKLEKIRSKEVLAAAAFLSTKKGGDVQNSSYSSANRQILLPILPEVLPVSAGLPSRYLLRFFEKHRSAD